MFARVAVALVFVVGCSDSRGTRLVVDEEFVECRGGGEHGKAPSEEDPGIFCHRSLIDCSDGRRYEVRCASPTNDGPLACACLINGARVGDDFAVAEVCPVPDGELFAGCGWAPDGE